MKGHFRSLEELRLHSFVKNGPPIVANEEQFTRCLETATCDLLFTGSFTGKWITFVYRSIDAGTWAHWLLEHKKFSFVRIDTDWKNSLCELVIIGVAPSFAD